jgi:hypothetical protein
METRVIIDGEVFDLKKLDFELAPYPKYSRYFINKYRENYERFMTRFLNPFKQELSRMGQVNTINLADSIEQYFLNSAPYSYKEAFEEQQEFAAQLFSVIDIEEMMKNLNHVKVKTDGIKLNNKKFNEHTGEFEEEEYHYIAELYRVDISPLTEGSDSDIYSYAVKVWCTSTNQEHYLWIDENACDINDPLDAVASTCIVPVKAADNIKYSIRQGDVFLFGLNDDAPEIDISPNVETRRLTKEEYFRLLIAQS